MPDFVVQSGEAMQPFERFAWFQKRREAMQLQGATWFQYSVDDADNPTITLIEGWRTRPETQPTPHFQMVKPDA